jgi:hypothetical protein
MVALVAGEGRMNEAERAALARELDKLVGGVNPDGTPHVDTEEVVDPELRLKNRRPPPSREKIAAVVEELAQARSRRRNES